MSSTANNIDALLEDDFEECTASLPSFKNPKTVPKRAVVVETRRSILQSVETMHKDHPIFAHLQVEESILHKIAVSNHRTQLVGDDDHTAIPKKNDSDTHQINMNGRRSLTKRTFVYDYESDAISLANSASSAGTRKSAHTVASHLYPSSAVVPIDQDSHSYPHVAPATSITKATKDASNKQKVTSSSKPNSVISGKIQSVVKSNYPKKVYTKNKKNAEQSPFKLILLISYPMVFGYLSVSLYILFDYGVVVDTSGLANLTGLVYFTPLEQILITQLYLAFGTSAGTIMEKHYSKFKQNHRDTKSRIISEKIVAYYFLFGLVASLFVSITIVLSINRILRIFAVSPSNHYNYIAPTLEYAYPILFFGPFVYFISSGLVPVLRTMNLGAYCLVRQLIGGAVFLITTTILMVILRFANSGAAWGIILGELCTGLFFLFNFLEPFHLRIKMLITRIRLACRGFSHSRFLNKTTPSSFVIEITGNSQQTRHKSGSKSRTVKVHTNVIPRIYLKAQRYGDFNCSLFCKFLTRGVINYFSYLTPPLTALIGIYQHYKYGGKNAHKRQIATGLASRYLGTYQSPLTGLIAGITSVIDYYWSRKEYKKFKKAFYYGLLIMFLFCACYTIVFESLLPYFVQSYMLESSYQKNIVKNGRIVFSFITFQTPFYMAVIMAQIFKQDKMSIFLTVLRLATGISWNIIYPLVTNSTDYMIHGIVIADILGGLSGLIYLFVKLKDIRKIIHEEKLKHKAEATIHRYASITQLEKPPESVYISLLEKVDGSTYEIKKDDTLAESTEIGYLEEEARVSGKSYLTTSRVQHVQTVQYLSQAEEQSMSAAHKITILPNRHKALSITDITSTSDRSKRRRKVTPRREKM